MIAVGRLRFGTALRGHGLNETKILGLPNARPLGVVSALRKLLTSAKMVAPQSAISRNRCENMTEPSPAVPSPSPTAPPSTRPARLLNAALTLLCLLFGFVVASFAVRNSDFWFHLALGRL